MLAKRRSCNESATQLRTLVSTTRIIRTWWIFIYLKMKSTSDTSTSLNLPQRYSTYYRYLLLCLTLPVQRGIHDINRSFAFRSSPGFIFHDSPGFETGDKKQLEEVLSFLEKKAKSTDVDDQLHAIWSVSLSQHTYWPLMVCSVVKGSVLFWTMLGLYCHWKRSFLRQLEQEMVFISLHRHKVPD